MRWHSRTSSLYLNISDPDHMYLIYIYYIILYTLFCIVCDVCAAYFIFFFFRSLLKSCLFWCNLSRFCYQDSRLARHVFGDKKPLGSDWDWWTGSVSKQTTSKRWEDERGWTKRKMGGQHPKYILDYTCMDAKRAVWNDCCILTQS